MPDLETYHEHPCVFVRLSGQDVERGTFNQRHSVLYDARSERRYIPLNNYVGDGTVSMPRGSSTSHPHQDEEEEWTTAPGDASGVRRHAQPPLPRDGSHGPRRGDIIQGAQSGGEGGRQNYFQVRCEPSVAATTIAAAVATKTTPTSQNMNPCTRSPAIA